MNPAFIIIVIIVCVAIWFLASALYKPIGKFFKTIINDSINTMKEKDEEEKDEQ